jgi:protein-S-isoprenylcysteine O-methyltransferase Ste14
MLEKLIRPKSVARELDPWITLVVMVLGYLWLRTSSLNNTLFMAAVIAMVMVPMILLELKDAAWRGSAIPSIPRNVMLDRSCIKWIGVITGIAFISFFWWLAPMFHKSSYHDPMYDCLWLVMPIMVFGSLPLIIFTEYRMGEYKDYNYEFGLFTLGRWREINWYEFRSGISAWFVKAFFLPMNFCTLVQFVGKVRGSEVELLTLPFKHAYEYIEFLYIIPMIVAIIPGYLLSARIIGTHIRKADVSWFGWAVTLWFYPPFNTAISKSWFRFNEHISQETQNWIVVFENNLPLLVTFGVIIIAANIIHYWGEAILGIRASNLTNRGVITNGPYRFLRHPIYFSKLIAWFFAMLPFMSGDDTKECFYFMFSFLVVCGGYYMRSYVEERLMADDPDYVAYALYMDKKGWLSFTGRRFPPITFAWRLARWKRLGIVKNSCV